MKVLVALVALILVGCLPAHAQSYVGSSSTAYGSSINGGQTGMEKTYFPSHFSLPDPPSRMTITSGTNTEFVPSLFMPYDKALAKGAADLVVKPKTLAEVARENRKEQRAKAQTSFVQDASGKLVKVE